MKNVKLKPQLHNTGNKKKTSFMAKVHLNISLPLKTHTVIFTNHTELQTKHRQEWKSDKLSVYGEHCYYVSNGGRKRARTFQRHQLELRFTLLFLFVMVSDLRASGYKKTDTFPTSWHYGLCQTQVNLAVCKQFRPSWHHHFFFTVNPMKLKTSRAQINIYIYICVC